VARRRLGFWRRFAVCLVKPVMVGMTRRTWAGMQNIPPSGPVIIIANHMSHADPLVLAHYIYDSGRWPVFLAKASVFEVPVVGWILRAVEQTPVSRGTVDAAKALDAAIDAIKAGKAVVIYPEGTTTKEPDLWPMRGKTGAARLWLATGAPVVPVVMWGPERLFDPRTKRLRPVPHTPVTVVTGRPLDLSGWVGAAPTAATLNEITEHLMLTLRGMLAQIRGGTPPPLWTAPANAAPPASAHTLPLAKPAGSPPAHQAESPAGTTPPTVDSEG
jgi:1-acyl-sn-glycerol-3-phosphate acyltransferase